VTVYSVVTGGQDGHALVTVVKTVYADGVGIAITGGGRT